MAWENVGKSASKWIKIKPGESFEGKYICSKDIVHDKFGPLVEYTFDIGGEERVLSTGSQFLKSNLKDMLNGS